ncbi:MAG: flagellar basal body-associated protein FliL [Burkholderiaceae bacterium]
MKPLPEKKSGRSRLLAISVSLVFIVGAGATVWMSHNASAEASVDKSQREAEKPPAFVVMDPLTINLQPENESAGRFLQVAFTVKVADDEHMALFKLYMPEMQSRSILLFSGKKASEISTAEGKNQLSREVQAELNQPFKAMNISQMVSDVYFTTFVIQ